MSDSGKISEIARNLRQNYREYLLDAAVVGIPLLICFALSSGLFEWLIDDAGISFVYSRNLADGHGLVSQPGMEPVEGFSNFLWVLLMTPFFFLGLFDPFITVKTVSIVLVGISFFYLHRAAMILSDRQRLVSLVSLLLLATNTSFVIWTCSGLENPLYAMLICMLLFQIIRNLEIEQESRISPQMIAITSSALALTRPDGIVYAVAFPFVLFVGFLIGQIRARELVTKLWKFSITIIGIIGSFMAFRLLYFGDSMPNTYYVKGGPGTKELIKLLTLQKNYLIKLQELWQSIFGDWLWLFIPLVLLALSILSVKLRRYLLYDVTLITLMGLALAAYLLLGIDYMREYRFATNFLGLLYLSLTVAVYRLLSSLRLSKIPKGILLGVLLALAGIATYTEHRPRYQAFCKRPSVSFTRVANNFGLRFNRIAEYLELENPSFLVPDIGGTLYYSNLRIIDLAGLCDKTIAKTRRYNLSAFHEYVFEDVKPTIIHIHGYFTAVSRLDEDERFTRDYVAIHLTDDEAARKRLGRDALSGDFVRKDAVKGVMDKLEKLQDGTAGI